jgi:hypothetical protein
VLPAAVVKPALVLLLKLSDPLKLPPPASPFISRSKKAPNLKLWLPRVTERLSERVGLM